MNRRKFLIGTGAILVAEPMSADPPPIHTLDRLHLDVEIQLDVSSVPVTGWKVTVNEDISMDVLAWNPGPRGAKFCYAKPGGIAHPWVRQEEWFVGPGESMKLVYRRKPDNEDMFFYAEIEDPRGSNIFRPVTGDRPNSNAGIQDNKTKCHMSWNSPQELHLQVQPTPG
jgi:hypothetical protein